MSRRRTTAKIYRASGTEENAAPPATEAPASTTETGESAAPASSPGENPVAAALGPWLAAESAQREASEQRTADIVGRYYKVTLAILCLNMVVGGANVAALFMRSGEPRTVVLAPPTLAVPPPATAVAQPAAATTTAPAAIPVSPENPGGLPATGLSETSSPVDRIPLLGKAPLLEKPARPAARPSREREVARPARAVTTPAKSSPTLTAKLIDAQSVAEPSHLAAERW